MLEKWLIEKTPIYFEQTNSLPMIDIQINFKAGSIYDGAKSGLADLAVGMFATETKKYNEENLINKITDIGVSINTNVNKEFFSVTIRLLSDSDIVTKTISILKEIFSNPRFDKNILEREKSQTISHISYVRQQAGYLASLEFSKTIYQNNPYSQPTIGHKDTVSSVTVTDIKKFYETYICSENANICIVGDIDKNKASNFAQEIISSLPTGIKNDVKFIQESPDTIVIKKQFKSTQTCIISGHQLFMEIDNPLYFPLKVGNEILGGGGLNSKLFNKVREELGLVYNVGSSLNISPDYGSFIISAQTSNHELALKTINDVYNDFINSDIDDETLKNTKKHIQGTHLLGSVKNSSKLNMLSIIANKDLPIDFFSTYVDKVNMVDAKSIKNAFQQIQDNAKITVMVGDFSDK
jgi:predicted Zn-dependent peptidase